MVRLSVEDQLSLRVMRWLLKPPGIPDGKISSYIECINKEQMVVLGLSCLVIGVKYLILVNLG